jgi:hypothetical protein
MIGSVIFKFLTSQSISLAKIANGVFLVSSASFMICALFENEILIYAAYYSTQVSKHGQKYQMAEVTISKSMREAEEEEP